MPRRFGERCYTEINSDGVAVGIGRRAYRNTRQVHDLAIPQDGEIVGLGGAVKTAGKVTDGAADLAVYFQDGVPFPQAVGAGPKGPELARTVQYPTPARQAVALRLDQEMMAEELRLLYVAMTRAREKLILSVALTAGRKTLTELGEDLTLPVSPMTLSVQPSVGHWVLLYAIRDTTRTSRTPRSVPVGRSAG